MYVAAVIISAWLRGILVLSAKRPKLTVNKKKGPFNVRIFRSISDFCDGIRKNENLIICY